MAEAPKKASHLRQPPSRKSWPTGVCLVTAVCLALLPHANLLVLGLVPMLQALLPVLCTMTVILGAVLALHRWWVRALVLFLGALLGMLPIMVSAPDLPPSPNGIHMTVLSINVEHAQANVSALAEDIQKHRVEILVLVETDELFIKNLLERGIKEILPFRSLPVTPGGTAGTAILSSYPLHSEGGIPMEDDMMTFDHPSVVIEHPRFGLIRVVGVHPYAPVVGGAIPWRKILGSLDEWQLMHSELPLVLAGDFNASRSHPAFRNLARDFSDTSAAAGFFPIPTWPVTAFFPAVVSIDHILVRGLTATEWQRIRIPNTDHFGVLARVSGSVISEH